MNDEMVCQELVEVVTDYLEEAMPPRDRARFESHLPECPFCTRYVDQMRAVSRELRAEETEKLPAERRAALLAEFRKSL
jgi:anti-sigma factor (TIGR02949 family)